jgi:hypothetical protein
MQGIRNRYTSGKEVFYAAALRPNLVDDPRPVEAVPLVDDG